MECSERYRLQIWLLWQPKDEGSLCEPWRVLLLFLRWVLIDLRYVPQQCSQSFYEGLREVKEIWKMLLRNWFFLPNQNASVNYLKKGSKKCKQQSIHSHFTQDIIKIFNLYNNIKEVIYLLLIYTYTHTHIPLSTID